MRQLLLLIIAGLVVATGCARPQVTVPTQVADVPVEGYKDTAQQIQKNPIDYLKESLAETRRLRSSTTHFQRQERLGLIPQLKEQENIRAEFREEPFSVKFTWLDDDSEYQQCVFVKGRNDDKVLLMPRKGVLGQPPGVQKYPASYAVLFQKARNPITDFGPRRMMERVLDRIEKAEKVGNVAIKLAGTAEIGPRKEPCFHLELRYPPKDQFACKLQDLYISVQTKLPVATYLWMPAKEERTEASLDGMYAYNGLDDSTHHGDSVFVLDNIGREISGTSGVKTARSSNVDSEAAPTRAAIDSESEK
jgi:hypothetical protein